MSVRLILFFVYVLIDLGKRLLNFGDKIVNGLLFDCRSKFWGSIPPCLYLRRELIFGILVYLSLAFLVFLVLCSGFYCGFSSSRVALCYVYYFNSYYNNYNSLIFNAKSFTLYGGGFFLVYVAGIASTDVLEEECLIWDPISSSSMNGFLIVQKYIFKKWVKFYIYTIIGVLIFRP